MARKLPVPGTEEISFEEANRRVGAPAPTAEPVPQPGVTERPMTRVEASRFPQPATQGQGVMYGTRQGIATSMGDATAANNYRDTMVRSGQRMRAEGLRAAAEARRSALPQTMPGVSSATVTPPSAAQAPGALRRAVSSVGSGVSAGAKIGNSVGAALLPFGAGFSVGAALGPKPLDVQGPGRAPDQTAIPAGTGYGPGPGAVPEVSPLGIGPNNELTRNVGNAINAVSGGLGQGIVRAPQAVNSALGFARGVGAGRTAAIQSPPDAPVGPIGQQPIPAGNSTAGAGRGTFGTVADPRTNGITMGASLGSVPKQLPSGMIDNTIYRTQQPNGTTVFSGRNVQENAPYVDAYGRKTGDTGTLSTISGGQEGMERNLRAAQIYAGMNGSDSSQPMQTQVNDLSSSFRDDVKRYNDNFDRKQIYNQLDRSARLGGTRERQAAIQALGQFDATGERSQTDRENIAAGERNNVRTNDANLRGDVIKGEYGLRSAGITAGATRRAGELQMMQTLADRQTIAAAMKAAGGDPGRAATLLEQGGLVDAAGRLRDGVAKTQGIAQADDKIALDRRGAVRDLLKPGFASKDSKSGYDDPALDAATVRLDELTGGSFARLPAAQQQQLLNQVRAELRTDAGQLRQPFMDRVLQGVGLQAPPPRREGAFNPGGTVSIQGAAGVLPFQPKVGSVLRTDPKTGRAEVLDSSQLTDRDIERMRGLR